MEDVVSRTRELARGMIDFLFGDWIWNSTPALPKEVDIR
jgi:hypothetical protein